MFLFFLFFFLDLECGHTVRWRLCNEKGGAVQQSFCCCAVTLFMVPKCGISFCYFVYVFIFKLNDNLFTRGIGLDKSRLPVKKTILRF